MPQSEATAKASGHDATALREIALRQKVILICILLQILCLLAMPLIPAEAVGLIQLVYLGTVVVGAIFVLLLAMRVYGPAGGLLLGFFALVPLLGIVILLLVNARATYRLRQAGIRVGLLGANLASLPASTDASP